LIVLLKIDMKLSYKIVSVEWLGSLKERRKGMNIGVSLDVRL
jgi:hypothetical protein